MEYEADFDRLLDLFLAYEKAYTELIDYTNENKVDVMSEGSIFEKNGKFYLLTYNRSGIPNSWEVPNGFPVFMRNDALFIKEVNKINKKAGK